ncbi:DUF928 domain-containing protein [Leptolyngbya sp. 'hensonii']|uniref:DUF928 domain-containing protein n=1 Tax=Leptolyngbya sp. 'hensonii' TaxID=1922337 RepID=UPI001559DA55|nr:DUF928 domain-containing protein [Leptolyngbya sp. 'hensonii']
MASFPELVLAGIKVRQRGIPGRREPAGSRDPQSCIAPNQKNALVALVPPSNRSVTLAEYPTFLWYVPEHSAPSIDFELRDERNTTVLYKTTIETQFIRDSKSRVVFYDEKGDPIEYGRNGKPVKSGRPRSIPGVLSLTIPGNAGVKALEVNKTYLWYFEVNCPELARKPGDKPADPEDNDIYVGGWIRRVAKPDLLSQIQNAKPEERLALLAAQGIWNETISTLADLRRTNPQNQVYAKDWADLLKSVELADYAQEPLVNCCLPGKNQVSSR